MWRRSWRRPLLLRDPPAALYRPDFSQPVAWLVGEPVAVRCRLAACTMCSCDGSPARSVIGSWTLDFHLAAILTPSLVHPYVQCRHHFCNSSNTVDAAVLWTTWRSLTLSCECLTTGMCAKGSVTCGLLLLGAD